MRALHVICTAMLVQAAQGASTLAQAERGLAPLATAGHGRALGAAAAFTGMTQPTCVSWDGRRVLISIKAGYVLSFDTAPPGGWAGAALDGGTTSSPGAPIILDISAEVANYADHGLLGMTYSAGFICAMRAGCWPRRVRRPPTRVRASLDCLPACPRPCCAVPPRRSRIHARDGRAAWQLSLHGLWQL